MEHILNIDTQSHLLNDLFASIAQRNTILFLGAGASVGDKKYLSREIIEYCEDKLHVSLDIQDITRFIDILSASPKFDRMQFDQMVFDILKKYKITEGHLIMASMPWREIITTNYDLLVEQAFEAVSQTPNQTYSLKRIRSVQDIHHRTSNDEIRYIKLNGCLSDIDKYKLVFSTDDFKRASKFYKEVLNQLRDLSYNISFLAAGYSFTDDFSRQLFEKFDSHGYRERRWIYSITPRVNEHMLASFTDKRICIIQCTFEEFMQKYRKWEDEGFARQIAKSGTKFSTSQGSQISLTNRVSALLEGHVKQLNPSYKASFHVSDSEFYKGAEPTYEIVIRNVDVVKSETLKSVRDHIEQVVKTDEIMIPIIFLTGEFGIGKTTFALRLIHEMQDDSTVAFDIMNFNGIKKEALTELLSKANAKRVILYCDEIEADSAFKDLLNLRRDLSIEQLNDVSILVVAPIRENMLARQKITQHIKNSIELKVSGKLAIDEIDDLLNKLLAAELVVFRDKNEKNALIQRIQNSFGSDSFVTMMEVITNGKHRNDILQAYNELGKVAKDALVYTALFHKHQLHVPASWLKRILNIADWQDFLDNVVRAEAKGLLIQEDRNSANADPDLYFRTKHSVIAAELIRRVLPTADQEYNCYERIVRSVGVGQINVTLLIDLIKGIRQIETFSADKINNLFDLAHGRLGESPYFLLNYAINLQNRRRRQDLERALSILVYAESLLPHRNHRFMHRRGSINFDLARLSFDEEKELNLTDSYLREAKDLFTIKQILDPFTDYSYVDYLRLLLWELNNVDFDAEEEIIQRISIQELFDMAHRTIGEGNERITRIHREYLDYLGKHLDGRDYAAYLDEVYEDRLLRPFACILKHQYYSKKAGNDDMIERIVSEMESYLDNDEIVKFLFRYYGQTLYKIEHRLRLFDLARKNVWLEKALPLPFHYFQFIAESYNENFYYGRSVLLKMENKFNGWNPEYHYVWSNTEGIPEQFTGVIQTSETRKKKIRVARLKETFSLTKGDYTSFPVGTTVQVTLHFYLNGIRAKIEGAALTQLE